MNYESKSAPYAIYLHNKIGCVKISLDILTHPFFTYYIRNNDKTNTVAIVTTP